MDSKKFTTAAFGMGCFWGPDALFGAQNGIRRTRVGYAGGEKEAPTYKSIGNHTETILVEFNTEEIGYPELLELFWDNHHYSYSTRGKNQYASRIFYSNKEQKEQAKRSKAKKESEGKVATEIQQLNFTVAEDYHQKYRLRHSRMMDHFSKMAPDKFRDSPLAAKLNAYAAGHLNRSNIENFDPKDEAGLKDRALKLAR